MRASIDTSRLQRAYSFIKPLFLIAVPIMLQNLVNSMVNMADTVMIGRLGTSEIAAVGLGNQIFFLLNMFLFGISSGGSVFTAQYWGKKDIVGIKRTTGLCLLLVTIIAALFTFASRFFPAQIIALYSRDAAVIRLGAAYLSTVSLSFIPFGISFVFMILLRTIGRVRLSMTTTFISLGINLVLNWLFIFGAGPIPAMGVTGAAIATVIARLVEMFILIGMSYLKKYALAGTPAELFGFDLFFLKKYLPIALPVFVNEVLWSMGITMQSLVFGRSGTDALAAFNITNNVSMLTWVVFIGLGNATAVLIGNQIGEGNEVRARETAQQITRFNPLVAVGVGLLLFPLSRLLPFLFNAGEPVIAAAQGMLLLTMCMYPFRSFNMTMVIGVCRAGGDTVFCAVYDVFFLWVVALPLAAVAAYFFQAPALIIFLLLSSEEPLKAALGYFRLRSGKWLRNIT